MSALRLCPGKVPHDGLSATEEYKLACLRETTGRSDMEVVELLEQVGLSYALKALRAVPHHQELEADRIGRLLALDAAYWTMHLWSRRSEAAVLCGSMREAHLHAHGLISEEAYLASVRSALEPCWGDTMDSPATALALCCALHAVQGEYSRAVFGAMEAVGLHCSEVAREAVERIAQGDHRVLASVWNRGDPATSRAVFGAVFGVLDGHVAARARTAAWHVAYSVLSLLFILREDLGSGEADFARTFHAEALLPALIDIIDEVTAEGVAMLVRELDAVGDFTEATAVAEHAAREFFRKFREHQQSRIEHMAVVSMANRLQDTRCFKPEIAEPAAEVLIALAALPFLKERPLDQGVHRRAEGLVRQAAQAVSPIEMAGTLARRHGELAERKRLTKVLRQLLTEAGG